MSTFITPPPGSCDLARSSLRVSIAADRHQPPAIGAQPAHEFFKIGQHLEQEHRHRHLGEHQEMEEGFLRSAPELDARDAVAEIVGKARRELQQQDEIHEYVHRYVILHGVPWKAGQKILRPRPKLVASGFCSRRSSQPEPFGKRRTLSHGTQVPPGERERPATVPHSQGRLTCCFMISATALRSASGSRSGRSAPTTGICSWPSRAPGTDSTTADHSRRRSSSRRRSRQQQPQRKPQPQRQPQQPQPQLQPQPH